MDARDTREIADRVYKKIWSDILDGVMIAFVLNGIGWGIYYLIKWIW